MKCPQCGVNNPDISVQTHILKPGAIFEYKEFHHQGAKGNYALAQLTYEQVFKQINMIDLLWCTECHTGIKMHENGTLETYQSYWGRKNGKKVPQKMESAKDMISALDDMEEDPLAKMMRELAN